MSNTIKGCIAALAFVTFVGLPLTASAQAAPPAAQAPQTATAQGELVNVDVAAKTLSIKSGDREMQFSFTDETKITGASSPAGLASMQGSQATVRYVAKGSVNTATEIQISPKK